MANNSNRKAIEFMVQGALPPHSTNVLWMDTSVPTLPVLKIFENGAWTTVHTEQGKVDGLLAKTVLEQAKVIEILTDSIDIKIDELQQTVAKEENATANKVTILNRIQEFDDKVSPYLYDECSVEDINHMFETTTEDGLIIVPSGLITPEGTMPISVFKAITGLTPTE